MKKVNCASGTKFVSTSEEKTQINKQFCCDIVEMEAAGILLTANMHDVPVLFVKGISDTLHGGAEEFHSMYETSSDACFSDHFKLTRSESGLGILFIWRWL